MSDEEEYYEDEYDDDWLWYDDASLGVAVSSPYIAYELCPLSVCSE